MAAIKPANIISAPFAQRLQQLVNESPGANLPSGKGGARGRVPVLVRCTSETAAGASGADAQCYPAVILDPRADDTDPAELGAVWLTVLTEGGFAEPTEDAVYLGLVAGQRTISADTRHRVYAVPVDPALPVGTLNAVAASGRGWVAGLTPGDILKATLYTNGYSAAANGQEVSLYYSSGGRWEPLNGDGFDLEGIAASVGVQFFRDENGDPACVLVGPLTPADGCDAMQSYRMTLDGWGQNYVTFAAGGNELKDGTTQQGGPIANRILVTVSWQAPGEFTCPFSGQDIPDPVWVLVDLGVWWDGLGTLPAFAEHFPVVVRAARVFVASDNATYWMTEFSVDGDGVVRYGPVDTVIDGGGQHPVDPSTIYISLAFACSASAASLDMITTPSTTAARSSLNASDDNGDYYAHIAELGSYNEILLDDDPYAAYMDSGHFSAGSPGEPLDVLEITVSSDAPAELACLAPPAEDTNTYFTGTVP